MALTIRTDNVLTPLRGAVQDKLSPPNWRLFPAVHESSQRWQCTLRVSARLPRLRARREHGGRCFQIRHAGSRRSVRER